MLDKYTGGLYLVTRVVHVFDDKVYRMRVDIKRDSSEESLDA